MSNIKIHELAKELGMASKELLEKVNSMGIEVKSHMSVLKDMDVTAIKNTVKREKTGAETKIVKVAPKKASDIPVRQEFKVIVKAATHITANPEAKKPQAKPTPQQGNQGQNQNRPTGQNNNQGQNQNRPTGQYNNQGQNQNRPTGQNNNQGQNQNRPAGQYNNQGQNQNRPAGQYNNQSQNQNRPAGQSNNQGQSQSRPAGQYNNQGQNQSRPAGQSHSQGQNQNRPTGSHGQGENKNGGQNQNRPNSSYKGNNNNNNNNNAHGTTAPKPKYNVLPLQQKQRSKQRPKPAPKPVEPEIDLEEMEPGTKIVNVPITVAGFADQIEKTTSAIIMALMKMGIMANINQNMDEDTVVLLGEELGVPIIIGKVEEEVIEEGIEDYKDKEEDLKPRSPIITVMGHVDHGKTSLLDAIRKTNVASAESGGITQHIGASEINLNGQKIVFLDTPGHEAFTAMRARGAHATDMAVLVVAADDSVKPQTIESISHAKAAGVPIIVAINKMDKPGANPEKVKQDLTEHGILIEEWGGDTICVPVSAKSGEGIVTLLEMILLQAEVLELKANPNRLASGTVIEARLDKARGVVATLLVLNGTLKAGSSIIAGTCSGKIKAMANFKGDSIRKAGPATAVEILGLAEVPQAGDQFDAVKEDKVAREIAESRRIKQREEVMARNSSSTLEQLFSQMEEGETKDLNLIIKGDVQGSVGALTSSLEKLKNENIHVKILFAGVGTVTESDIMLANTSGAIIVAFNVRPSTAISAIADREGVEIRTYSVIYNVIDEVEAAMKGMLDPIYKEAVLGKIEIRDTFKVPNVGVIGGAYVLEGKVERNAEIRLVRDGIVIHEGKISSLKRFKDDAKEVSTGYECGIGIEKYNDIKEGDIIEAFKMEEVERK